MKILVIDHDPGTAHIIEAMLDDHDVEAARDARTGLLRVETAEMDDPFGLVLADASLPDLDTSALVNALHARPDRMFVVLMVGHHEPPISLAGADAALLKPFGRCELRDIVTVAARSRITAQTRRIRRDSLAIAG